MGNEVLATTETRSAAGDEYELDSLTGDAFRQEPLWKELYNSVYDIFFPKRLPPLELTSKPVNVVNPLEVKRNPKSTGVAIGAHILVLALLFWFLYNRIQTRVVTKPTETSNVDIKPFIPYLPKNLQAMGGGGGGGSHDLVQVSKGRMPKIAKEQITPPQVIKNDKPKLAVEPTVVMPPDVKPPDSNLPNLGVASSTQVTLASNGTGTGGGMGSGSGGGLGQGKGAGVGPGEGGGYGGGLYHVGGGVSAPSLISAVDPEFSDEARRAKYQGVCVVALIVDAQGNPQNVHAVRKLGMGLDEKAEAAVRQYKFKPAHFQGKPVSVPIQVEVNFRIY